MRKKTKKYYILYWKVVTSRMIKYTLANCCWPYVDHIRQQVKATNTSAHINPQPTEC